MVRSDDVQLLEGKQSLDQLILIILYMLPFYIAMLIYYAIYMLLKES